MTAPGPVGGPQKAKTVKKDVVIPSRREDACGKGVLEEALSTRLYTPWRPPIFLILHLVRDALPQALFLLHPP